MEIPIPDTTLVRNTEGRSLIETNKAGDEEYKIRKKLIKTHLKQIDEIVDLKEQINNLSTIVEQLKYLILDKK